ncbi:hypothetical protein EHQ68_08685 [Leptospira congkakensis]|uniref:Uncharacterized protein n=1 Tax=Leptospira congkakensis TaxID=2484932 RepID=A0A4Z1A3Y7_9LEPT|nr:hypothetical protein [Leptospira congkakensis]TGL88706.1 hypothetical protein EHQ69_14755 [Leptospira congkakensis]TGL89292.1 hypothetical protein EHQ68_08685 [Leptospira congkakensis]TGL97260.1 hypothetical protein EHQ70_08180 [Leptospira congkakensis]
MKPSVWKNVLLKNREVCNQLVLTEEKTNPNFSEDLLSENLVPFFETLSLSKEKEIAEETLLSLFQTLVTLVSKNFFKQNPEITNLFLETLHLFDFVSEENLTECISYLANVLVKVEEPKKELFLKRIQSFSKSTSTVEEWKILLTIFAWASGKPEYREEAKTKFEILPLPLKEKIQSIVGIGEETLSYPFPKRKGPPKETDPIHFRVIPGYTLFGGQFREIPLFGSQQKGESDPWVVTSGLSQFSLYLDQFGTNLISKEKISVPEKQTTAAIQSSFWKLIVGKKLDLKQIATVIESEAFVLCTLQNSYNLYLFYLGST